MVISRFEPMPDGTILRLDSPSEGWHGCGKDFKPYKTYSTYEKAFEDLFKDRDYDGVSAINIEIQTYGNYKEDSPFKPSYRKKKGSRWT